MIWIKKISVFILLVLLTSSIVMVPQYMNKENEKNLLNQVTYREIYVGNRPKPTSEQVARLYFNDEINIGYNTITTKRSDSDTLKKSISEYIEMLFGENKEICKKIKSALKDSNIFYSRNSSLILIDNKPTTLNFVSCFVYGECTYLEILYEEKTKTVISFTMEAVKLDYESIEEMYEYINQTGNLVSDYYENTLHLARDEYSCILNVPELTKKEDIYPACSLFSFSILKKYDKEYEANAEQDKTDTN